MKRLLVILIILFIPSISFSLTPTRTPTPTPGPTIAVNQCCSCPNGGSPGCTDWITHEGSVCDSLFLGGGTIPPCVIVENAICFPGPNCITYTPTNTPTPTFTFTFTPTPTFTPLPNCAIFQMTMGNDGFVSNSCHDPSPPEELFCNNGPYYLIVERDNCGAADYEQQVIMQFETSGQIPAGSTISNVFLRAASDYSFSDDNANLQGDWLSGSGGCNISDYVYNPPHAALNTPISSICTDPGGCCPLGCVNAQSVDIPLNPSGMDINNPRLRLNINAASITGGNQFSFIGYEGDVTAGNGPREALGICWIPPASPTPGGAATATFTVTATRTPTPSPTITRTFTRTATFTNTPTEIPTQTAVPCDSTPPVITPFPVGTPQIGTVGFNTFTYTLTHGVNIGHSVILVFLTTEILFDERLTVFDPNWAHFPTATDPKGNIWRCQGLTQPTCGIGVYCPAGSGIYPVNGAEIPEQWTCIGDITTALDNGDVVSVSLRELFATPHIATALDVTLKDGVLGCSLRSTVGEGGVTLSNNEHPQFQCGMQSVILSGTGGCGWPHGTEMFCETHTPDCPGIESACVPVPDTMLDSFINCCNTVHCLDTNGSHQQFKDVSSLAWTQRCSNPNIFDCVFPQPGQAYVGVNTIQINHSSAADVHLLHTGTCGDFQTCNPRSPRDATGSVCGRIGTTDLFNCLLPWDVDEPDATTWDHDIRQGIGNHDMFTRWLVSIPPHGMQVGFSIDETLKTWQTQWNLYYAQPVQVTTPPPTSTVTITSTPNATATPTIPNRALCIPTTQPFPI